MRFLMRNCLKHTQQCKSDMFEKRRVVKQWYPNQLYISSRNKLKYGNPLKGLLTLTDMSLNPFACWI